MAVLSSRRYSTLVAILLPLFLSRWIGVVAAASKPNILFIMSDDQDLLMDSMNYMPNVQKLIGQAGTTYTKHYCTVALCCPSRVNLLTGRAAHNTNVTALGLPYGGYPRFTQLGLQNDYLPGWLQAAGYNTYYVGKLMNGHDIWNYDKPHVTGLTHSSFLLEPYTYQYTNTTWTNDTLPLEMDLGTHTTDLTNQKALTYLADAVQANQPFFMMVAPIGPHVELFGSNRFNQPENSYSPTKGSLHPPVPQDKYNDSFSTATVPRTPNFNPDNVSFDGIAMGLLTVSSGASWISQLPKQSQDNVDSNDEFYRARIRVVAGLDDMVGNLVNALSNYGILDNTYVVYTTDNGYHIGQHRLQPGKQCGYENDINIPFVMRGPGVPANVSTEIVTSHTDVAPTIFNMAGIPLRSDFDGQPMPMTQSQISAVTGSPEHLNVEYWGKASGGENPAYQSKKGNDNTYKSMRVIGQGYSYYYSVWCNNEHELYDMINDPYQLNNMYLSLKDTAGNPSLSTQLIQPFNRPAPQLLPRLDALLMVLKSCAAQSCTQPWNVLHPNSNVTTLSDAMGETFDSFYQSQPQVSFTSCDEGYIPASEGPQQVVAYTLKSGTPKAGTQKTVDTGLWRGVGRVVRAVADAARRVGRSKGMVRGEL